MSLNRRIHRVRFASLLRPWPYVAAVGLFLIYSMWISWPYMHSVIVRDAAVTSWSIVAKAPIDGTVDFSSIGVNERVGAGGLVATIHNDHASSAAVDAAALKIQLARTKKEEASKLLENIKMLDGERRELKSHYADLFRSQLDSDIAQYEGQVAAVETRLDTIRTISERKTRLALSGAGAFDTADESSLRVAEVAQEVEELRADLRRARGRRAAADHGVFIEADGEDPGWARGTRMALKLEKKQARFELRAAEAELASAEEQLSNAKADLKRQSVALITARPGQTLWRRNAASGMPVRTGDPIAEFVNCDDLLVDMPVSDTEASLVAPGERANVVVEGDLVERAAKVVLVRGAASTLDGTELAAISKDRRHDDAQVLLRLDAVASDFDTCPVGRAAYVDFPGIGLVDIIRARLRL